MTSLIKRKAKPAESSSFTDFTSDSSLDLPASKPTKNTAKPSTKSAKNPPSKKPPQSSESDSSSTSTDSDLEHIAYLKQKQENLKKYYQSQCQKIEQQLESRRNSVSGKSAASAKNTAKTTKVSKRPDKILEKKSSSFTLSSGPEADLKSDVVPKIKKNSNEKNVSHVNVKTEARAKIDQGRKNGSTRQISVVLFLGSCIWRETTCSPAIIIFFQHENFREARHIFLLVFCRVGPRILILVTRLVLAAVRKMRTRPALHQIILNISTVKLSPKILRNLRE